MPWDRWVTGTGSWGRRVGEVGCWVLSDKQHLTLDSANPVQRLRAVPWRERHGCRGAEVAIVGRQCWLACMRTCWLLCCRFPGAGGKPYAAVRGIATCCAVVPVYPRAVVPAAVITNPTPLSNVQPAAAAQQLGRRLCGRRRPLRPEHPAPGVSGVRRWVEVWPSCYVCII